MSPHRSILVVDDEPIQRESLAAWLAEDGYDVDQASSGDGAVDRARARPYALCFIDLMMPPGMDGIETMAAIRKIRPDATIVIVTAYATVESAIAAMKQGAQEYIVKPCNPEEISLLVQRIFRMRNLERENILLRKRLSRLYTFHDIVSKSPRMHEIFGLVRDVASLRSTVLIEGESGTGKEMIARAIHQAGDRVKKPFVAVSCGALAETLLESELFGHERGSFTGATHRRKGKFESAHGGTLLLDEIGDISPKLQVDLLRVLQERKFFRVGGSEELHVDVRIIAATKAELVDAVRAGKFREDLYYRLNVIHIRLPPLRERLEDVPLLARHFVEHIALELGRNVRSIADDAIAFLLEQRWPGNVRQLENAIERAIVNSHDAVLTRGDFAFLSEEEAGVEAWKAPLGMTLHEMEQRMIVAILQHTRGNMKAAAAALGIDRSTLYDKIHRYGIQRPGSELPTERGEA